MLNDYCASLRVCTLTSRIRTELYLEEQEERERQREKVRKTVLFVYGDNISPRVKLQYS